MNASETEWWKADIEPINCVYKVWARMCVMHMKVKILEISLSFFALNQPSPITQLKAIKRKINSVQIKISKINLWAFSQQQKKQSKASD